jgi:hypothetical protein
MKKLGFTENHWLLPIRVVPDPPVPDPDDEPPPKPPKPTRSSDL